MRKSVEMFLSQSPVAVEYVYELHFDSPISDKHTCQHYIGFALDVWERLADHKAGRGARLTQVANERGIGYRIVRIWRAEPGMGRKLERWLKNQKNGKKLCPVCQAARRGTPAPVMANLCTMDQPEVNFM